jgi:hypothetical protein
MREVGQNDAYGVKSLSKKNEIRRSRIIQSRAN